MTHIAIQEVDEAGNPVTWGAHVTDEEYGAAPGMTASAHRDEALARQHAQPLHVLATRARERTVSESSCRSRSVLSCS